MRTAIAVLIGLVLAAGTLYLGLDRGMGSSCFDISGVKTLPCSGPGRP